MSGGLDSSLFGGLLAEAFEIDQKRGIYVPVTPQKIEESIPMPTVDSFSNWRWKDFKDMDLVWPVISRIRLEGRNIIGKEMLLYAQRKYIARRFPDFDPSQTDLWEMHNRPWDFDHILPCAKTYYKQFSHRDATNEWLYSTGNLRALPMEENRSDQATDPKDKVHLCSDSFLTPRQLDEFNRASVSIENITDVLAFLTETRRRLFDIYKEWYDSLNIGFLVDGSSRRAPN